MSPPQAADSSALHAKLEATLIVRLTVAGYAVMRLAVGGYLVSRWDCSKHCGGLRELAAFALLLDL